MELRVLRYYLAVAREENITRAANILCITQPTLSRQMAELEEELNTKLFERSNRKISLTEAGMLFRRRVMLKFLGAALISSVLPSTVSAVDLILTDNKGKNMKIVMLTGSPHRQGTSALLADEFIAGQHQKGIQLYALILHLKK